MYACESALAEIYGSNVAQAPALQFHYICHLLYHKCCHSNRINTHIIEGTGGDRGTLAC